VLYNAGMTTADADVLILGGGVIGLACAHYLLEAGRSVRVIDRGAAGSATSHGNCGTITPSHAPPLAAPGMIAKAMKWMLTPDAPLYVQPRLDPALATWLLRFAGRCNRRDWLVSARARAAILESSRHLLGELVTRHGLACEFTASGLRYVYRDTRAFDAGCADLPALRELGIDTRVLDSGALAAAEPALLTGLAGGIHFPNDAQLRPDRYAAELARLVRAAGGVIEEGIEVTGFERDGSRISAVVTSDGRRRAPQVLAALGPWSPTLLRQLDLRLPIQPGKGYSITYARPSLAPRVPVVLKERSVCVTAWDSGFRLGSTMEFSGYDATLNRRRLDALERSARDYLREPVGPAKVEEWFGWRPMTWDDLPILGRAPRHDNLWLATGHGMLGVSMSATTGHLLADLICARTPIIDPTPSSPLRFEHRA
jgi:D-amino-acid dehydrogenase